MGPTDRGETSARLLPRGVLPRVVARATTSSASLVGVYYLAPLDGTSTGTVVAFVVGLVAVVGLVGWQVRAVLAAPYPLLRSIEALAIIMPSSVVLWSVAAVVLSRYDPAAFSEVLDRTGALYLTMSVLATVGFGDVVAVTDGARALMTVQMVGNLLLVGVVVRLFVGAAQPGRSMRDDERREPR
ncbi:potassium channel family protein [Sanguibacter sp. 25GB23B1]|uniref:potassium channel family protein n=1 Tax=unclassified Sanguibacter TaxID=2645534 RepID=UPI0032AEC33B